MFFKIIRQQNFFIWEKNLFLKMGEGGKTAVVVVILIIILAGVGFLVWYFLYYNKKKKEDPPGPTPGPKPGPDGTTLKLLREENFLEPGQQFAETAEYTVGIKFTIIKPITVREIRSRFQFGKTGTTFNIWREDKTQILRLTATTWNNSVLTNIPLSVGAYRIGVNYPGANSLVGRILLRETLPVSSNPEVVTIDGSFSSTVINTFPETPTNVSLDHFINFLYST
jgi:hypothetical protein